MTSSSYESVALLVGGTSAEREVSFLSADAIMSSLEELGYAVTKVDPNENLAAQLKNIKPDVVYNGLYGTFGEDGAIPGLLEVMKIPYTHSGIRASAIAFDKLSTLHFAESIGIKCPKRKVLSIDEIKKFSKVSEHVMDLPYVIKPIAQGSSVGVQVIIDKNTFPNFGKWHYGKDALVEEYIEGSELSCSVVRGSAVAVTELVPEGDSFYDYQAKYHKITTKHIVPAQIPSDIYQECLSVSEKIHKALGCRSISRSDFRYSPKRGLFFLEINTHPGFAPTSILPEAAATKGMSFTDLVKILIEDAKLDLSNKES